MSFLLVAKADVCAGYVSDNKEGDTRMCEKKKEKIVPSSTVIFKYTYIEYA